MMKDVEKIPQPGVAAPRAFVDKQRVLERQHAFGANKSHEVDEHARRLAVDRPIELRDLARGKRERGRHREARDFLIETAGILANCLPLGIELMKKPNELEKLDRFSIREYEFVQFAH